MLKKYHSLKEFCDDNHYSFESLITIDDTYYIGLSADDHLWHVGTYTHNTYSYDVELIDIQAVKTISQATSLLTTLLKD